MHTSVAATHNQHVWLLVNELHLTLSLLQPFPMVRKLISAFAQLLWVVFQPRESRVYRVSLPLSRRRRDQPEDASAQSIVADIVSEDRLDPHAHWTVIH